MLERALRCSLDWIMFLLLFCACASIDSGSLQAKVEKETQQGTFVSGPASTAKSGPPTVQAPTIDIVESAIPTYPVAAASTPSIIEDIVAQSTTPNTSLMVGPLVAFFLEDDDFYLSILDIGTGDFREIRNELFDQAFEPQWFGNGCEMFVSGSLLDLKGNIVWRVPTELIEVAGNFGGTRLSPSKSWLAYPIFSGEQTYEAAQFVDVGIVRLTPPFTSTVVSKNGGAYPGVFDWSSDEKWLVFSDYDVNGILQIYMTSADGKDKQQLTSHIDPIGRVTFLSFSPDDRQVVFAVTNLLNVSLPYQYDQNDEGWVGIVSLSDLSELHVTPDKMAYVKAPGIWWNSNSTQIVFVANNLPLTGSAKQIYWAEADSGKIIDSYYEPDSPFGPFNFAVAVGDSNTLLLGSRESLVLLENRGKRHQNLGTFEPQGLIRDLSAAPFSFPGEQNCQS